MLSRLGTFVNIPHGSKDLFLSTALLNRFIMSPTWIFGFCCICSVDITPSRGYCSVEHRLHGLRMQGERLIWGVVLGEAKLPSVFDFGYVSVLFFLSLRVSEAGEGRFFVWISYLKQPSLPLYFIFLASPCSMQNLRSLQWEHTEA